jgi:hypothetical protein
MIAYHGKPAIKKKYVARVMRHAKADAIIKGTYWDSSRPVISTGFYRTPELCGEVLGHKDSDRCGSVAERDAVPPHALSRERACEREPVGRGL